jgi:hypothetical protein
MSPEVSVLYRDFNRVDTEALMQVAGVEDCVVIAAATKDR